MKKLLSILLVLSMLLGMLALVGCPGPDNGGGGGGGGGGNNEWADSLDTDAVIRELNGQVEKVTVSVSEHYAYEVYAKEDSTDGRDKLIYERNKKIEERFGIKIDSNITKVTGSSDLQSHYNYVSDQLRTKRPSFDLIGMMAYQSGKLIAGGNYRDWRSDVPYAKESLTAGDAWWPAEMNKNSTVKGRQFVAVSDMSITLIDLSFAILFNKDMTINNNIASNYGALPSVSKNYQTMYDIVNDGAWTFEALTTITKDFWRDNTSAAAGGTLDAVDKTDTLGFLCSPSTELDNFAWASGFTYIQNDGVADPTIWSVSPSFDKLVGDLRNFLGTASKGAGTLGTIGVSYDERDAMFAEGRLMFTTNTLNALRTSKIKGMEADYGVLPYPKLNASQAKYLTGAQDNITVLSVPTFTRAKQLFATGAVVVALSAETNKSVNDTYYEMIVKHDSGIADKESVAMIDLIMEGRVYDLAIYHYSDLSFGDNSNATLGLYLRYLLVNETDQTASGLWTAAGGAIGIKMRGLLEKYASIGQ